MTPAEYRAMLVEAIGKRHALLPAEPAETDTVLTLTGNTRGMGARGTLLTYGPNGPVRSFTRAEVRRMLQRLDDAEAEAAR